MVFIPSGCLLRTSSRALKARVHGVMLHYGGGRRRGGCVPVRAKKPAPLHISSTRGVTGDMGVDGVRTGEEVPRVIWASTEYVRGKQSHLREIESPVKNRVLRACARKNEHGGCKDFVSALEEEE